MMVLINQSIRNLRNLKNVMTEMTLVGKIDVGHTVAEIAVVEIDPIEVVMIEEEDQEVPEVEVARKCPDSMSATFLCFEEQSMTLN